MKDISENLKYLGAHIPVPDFDTAKVREGHLRYIKKKKRYTRISLLLITSFASVFIGTSAFAATLLTDRIKTNKNGVTIYDDDSSTHINYEITYNDATVDTNAPELKNSDDAEIIFEEDPDYYNTKRYYGEGTVKEAYHSFKEARKESGIYIKDIDPCPGDETKNVNIFVDKVAGVNEYEVYAEFIYDDEGRICIAECIKGGNGIRVSNAADVVYQSVIENGNVRIIYQQTEEEKDGGKAYISINDYNIILEYHKFSNDEIEAYLKDMDLRDYK